MWGTDIVREGPHRTAAVWLVLVIVASSGCLGTASDDAPPPVPAEAPSAPPPAEITAEPEEPGILRIQGDEMIDRAARRFGWSGSGSLDAPYIIPGLELNDSLLVFQDLTRAVTLQRANLQGPVEGPALLLWNVSAFTVTESLIEAQNGPAVSLLETSWSRIEQSRLKSPEEAIQSLGSTAIDLLDNDLHAGTTAIRFEEDEGDHWIEHNRVHQSEVALLLKNSARGSSIYDNTLKAKSGIIAIDSPAPLLDGNRITAHDGIRLEQADGALLFDTSLHTTGTALTAVASDALLVEGLDVRGSGRGIHIKDSTLTILANLTYDGPGPAVEIDRGHTTVIADPLIVLPETGEGIVVRNAHTPTILDGEIAGGAQAVHFERTDQGAIIGTRIGSTNGPAITLDETDDSLIAETWLQAVGGEGVSIHGGDRHQVVANRLEYIGGGGISGQGTTDTEIAFNTFERGAGTPIRVADSARPIVEGNILTNTTMGIDLYNITGGTVHGNDITHGDHGIRVEGQSGPLQIIANRINDHRQEAVRLTDVDDVVVRANAFYSGVHSARGLGLTDITNGLIYDNYFDNGINVVASGRLGVTWSVTPHEGTNVVGGDTIAGNWWSDYTGADADGDGVGEIQHGILPYDDQLGSVPIPNYGVIDEDPIVSDSPPNTPTSLPQPSPVIERLQMLLGQSDTLDRILAHRS